jgi:peptidoglycan hydrolase-like protein with peptidoglycan-binding domain
MKKYLCTFAIVLMLPFAVHAQTTSEMLALIEDLLAQIRQLQALVDAQSSVVVNGECVFQRDLGVGDEGSDVSCLQRFLKAEGHFTYPEITGFFGEVTRVAVSRWQRVNQIGSGTYSGRFGPLSRLSFRSQTAAKQNTLTRSDVSVLPSVSDRSSQDEERDSSSSSDDDPSPGDDTDPESDSSSNNNEEGGEDNSNDESDANACTLEENEYIAFGNACELVDFVCAEGARYVNDSCGCGCSFSEESTPSYSQSSYYSQSAYYSQGGYYEGDPYSLPYLESNDFEFIGAFAAEGRHGESRFGFAQQGLAANTDNYNSDGFPSFFSTGHAYDFAVSEWQMPRIANLITSRSQRVPMATVLQDFVKIWEQVPERDTVTSNPRIGGYLPDGRGGMVGTMMNWYQAAPPQPSPFFYIDDLNNLADAEVSGLFADTITGHQIGGNIWKIPGEWQEEFGGNDMATGLTGVSIVSAHGVVAAMHSFKSSDVSGGNTPVSTTEHLHYHFSEIPRRGGVTDSDGNTIYYQGTRAVDGPNLFFPGSVSSDFGFMIPGTRSVAFVRTLAVGYSSYGSPNQNFVTAAGGKGNVSLKAIIDKDTGEILDGMVTEAEAAAMTDDQLLIDTRVHQLLLYDVEDMLDTTVPTHEKVPYAVEEFITPMYRSASPNEITGAAFFTDEGGDPYMLFEFSKLFPRDSVNTGISRYEASPGFLLYKINIDSDRDGNSNGGGKNLTAPRGLAGLTEVFGESIENYNDDVSVLGTSLRFVDLVE